MINEGFRCWEHFTAGQRYPGTSILASTLPRYHRNIHKAHSHLCNFIHRPRRLFCFQTPTRQPPGYTTLASAAARVVGAARDFQEHNHSPGGSAHQGKRSSGRQIMPSYLEISCNGMISCFKTIAYQDRKECVSLRIAISAPNSQRHPFSRRNAAPVLF